MPDSRPGQPPEEVQAIRNELDMLLNKSDSTGRRVGDSQYGVYAFYDYDGEPIYVGQTTEKLRTRIRRHLTNQRTDAVAMNVLDPFEVSEIELWPFWSLSGPVTQQVKATMNSAEYTVFQALLKNSSFHAILNEVPVEKTATIDLPASVKGRIVPDARYERRYRPDIRIARRASTIAKLAQVISERAVQTGLRQTLLTQARRLEYLANQRLKETEDNDG